MSPVRLETRIQELLDGVLHEEHWEELRRELEVSKEARLLYCRYAWLASALRQRSRGIQMILSGGVQEPAAHFAEVPAGRSIRRAVMAAAAVLVLVAVTLRLVAVREVPPPVIFACTPGTSYVLTHPDADEDATPAAMHLRDGSRLRITSGVVELDFASGVKSLVVGPADLTLQDEGHLHLNEGEAWFRVPPKAVGMRVTTNDLDIVDLGTEFGVRSSEIDHDELHVIKGTVRVTALRHRRQSEILATGEARRIDPIGRLLAIPCEPSAFLSALPKEMPAYEGPLDLEEGVHSLGKGGTGYSVFDSAHVLENHDGVPGDLLLSRAGNLSVAFYGPVDLRIEPPDFPLGDRPGSWNSVEDFGEFSCSPGAVVTVDDPASEIRVTKLSDGLFRWEFLKFETDERRFPANQTWEIHIARTDGLRLSKSADSINYAGLHLHVVSPSRAGGPAEERKPTPSREGRIR